MEQRLIVSRWGCLADLLIAVMLALVLAITISQVAKAGVWLRMAIG